MPGLDSTLIDLIDFDTTIRRIQIDTKTDFILAPHYNAIYSRAADGLRELCERQLLSGTYSPSLPHTMSVPKG
ncbi:MAG: hypothetical protein KAU31_07770, partial [Spirochaetaceae bacterium]|nr:hypothetical protein [Spirochaetaceae bacterium]